MLRRYNIVLFVRKTWFHTNSLGSDATAILRADDPVVVLECVHGLQNGAHTADVVVDLGVTDEVCRQVAVQLRLHLVGESVSQFTSCTILNIARPVQQTICILVLDKNTFVLN